jgi:hypothetical protein
MAAVGLMSGCSAAFAPAPRDALSTIVDASIAAFDKTGGSETTSDGNSQHALIYEPAAQAGKQIVTVDLADVNSPAFGAASSIAIHSMRTLIDSAEVKAVEIKRAGDTFTAQGAGFDMKVTTHDGLATRIDLSAGTDAGAPSQSILMSYGITPEAQKLFDSAK